MRYWSVRKMDKFEKRIREMALFRLYGPLLSGAQREILTSYLLYDLSIAEIATEMGISRAAAFDAIKKGEGKLEDYEGRLKMHAGREELLRRFEELKEKEGEELSIGLSALKEDIENGI